MQLAFTLQQKLAMLNSLQEGEVESSRALSKTLEVLQDIARSLLEELEVLSHIETLNTRERISLPQERERFERHFIRWALTRTGGHQTEAAEILGMKVTTLNMKMKRFGISVDEYTRPRSKQKNEGSPSEV